MGKVVVSPEALAKSAAKYRREILMMPVFALGEFLQRGVERHDGEGEVALAVLALNGGRAPVFFDLG